MQKIWRQSGEVILPKYTVATSGHDLLQLLSFKWYRTIKKWGIMKPAGYIKVLYENLHISAQNRYLGRRFIFHQDNDPRQTSKSVSPWLQKKEVNTSVMVCVES